jgi:Leucine-rich repeat (LRR) protein
LSGNKFTGVPAEVGQLEKLKILNLSNNELTGLPYEIGNLTQLEILDVSGNNNISEADLEKISSTLPNTEILK